MRKCKIKKVGKDVNSWGVTYKCHPESIFVTQWRFPSFEAARNFAIDWLTQFEGVTE